jgi:uncharacterized protein
LSDQYVPAKQEREIPIEIPPEKLSAEIMAAIIEDFIQREGTDYGLVEISAEKKLEQILKQIKRGDVKVVFDQTAESVSLITKRDFEKLIRSQISEI